MNAALCNVSLCVCVCLCMDVQLKHDRKLFVIVKVQLLRYK